MGADAEATEDPDVVRRADKIVLPGVGHFQATAFLEERGLRQAIEEQIAQGTPFLGFCVGLAVALSRKHRGSGSRGLAVFDASCDRFAAGKKVPHVGWNSLTVSEGSRLLRGVEAGSFVYFTHSYKAPVIHDTVAVTEYGETSPLPWSAGM